MFGEGHSRDLELAVKIERHSVVVRGYKKRFTKRITLSTSSSSATGSERDNAQLPELHLPDISADPLDASFTALFVAFCLDSSIS